MGLAGSTWAQDPAAPPAPGPAAGVPPQPAAAPPAPAQPAPPPPAYPPPTNPAPAAAPPPPTYAAPAAAPPPAPPPSDAPSDSGTVAYDESLFAPAPEPEPPPPPEPEPKKGRAIPPFSIRIDPLHWLLEGRLGIELEVEALDFLSIEVSPMFVTAEQPPMLHLVGRPDTLYQSSNGLGPLAGGTIGVGFWLDQKPFKGTVIRAMFTNNAISYETKDNDGHIDGVDHVERRLFGMIGSHSRWGFFTIASGLSIGAELNNEERCYVTADDVRTSGCPDKELRIKIDEDTGETVPLSGWLDPVYLDFRLSVGFVF